MPAHVPVHIWGAPGVGKSQIVRSVAAARNVDFIDLRAILLDPVDLRGLPYADGGLTKSLIPNFLPRSGQGILFLDELTSSPQMVQAACYSLVLDRKLGDYVLPDGYEILDAGNPASERGVHFSMPRPLRDRFLHLTLEPDLKEWRSWALVNKVLPHVIDFLRFRPGLLSAPGDSPDANAWPTPRAWEIVSRLLESWMARHTAPDPLLLQMLNGKVGEGAASEFYAFLKMLHELPSVDEILRNPATTKVPDEDSPSQSIAVGDSGDIRKHRSTEIK